MKITKTYNEPNEKPEEITVKQAEDDLEYRGYYESGTIGHILFLGQKTTLRTPWAFYHFEPTI